MNPVRAKHECEQRSQCVEFWSGNSAELDLQTLTELAVPVKGVSYRSPLRFLEIYANTPVSSNLSASRSSCFGNPDLTWKQIETTFLPRIPGVDLMLGHDVPQPPFAWREADAVYLALSFTYNTNAFFRIFNALAEEGTIAFTDVDSLLDKACVLLTNLYKTRDHFLIRNINNNFNMYLISKVVEFLVGKKRYDSERQELRTVRKSLSLALSMIPDQAHYSVIEKMGIAVGTGVCFMESRMREDRPESGNTNEIQEVSYRYYQKPIAIDHRSKLLEMIVEGGIRKNSFTLAVILDDATESVVDLLWLQDLLEQFPFLKANLLINTAQISINFSTHLLREVWRTPSFRRLISKLNSQFLLTDTYCPLISFQTSLLPSAAVRAIQKADAVYIKGANFFETCQIREKETFHAFVVYGPVSRLYTGLKDFDGVFAHVPAGTVGYDHRDASSRGVVSLTDIVAVKDKPKSVVREALKRE
jgi:hypothetical protein